MAASGPVDSGEERSDADVRLGLCDLIKEAYIKEGGIPLCKNDPFPLNLHELSNQELINVWDNLVIEKTRRKRDVVINRSLFTVVEICQMVAEILDLKLPNELIGAVETDAMLRESLVATVVGQGFKPSSLLSLALCASYYAVKFTRAFMEQYKLKYGTTAITLPWRREGQTKGPPSMERIQTPNENADRGQVTVRKNHASN